MSENFPMVKAIMWFDEIKVEAQAGGATIDWRFSGNQQIESGLAMYIQTPAKGSGSKYWLQLDDFTASGDAVSCASKPVCPRGPCPALLLSLPQTASYSSKGAGSNHSPTPHWGQTTTQNAATTQGGRSLFSVSGGDWGVPLQLPALIGPPAAWVLSRLHACIKPSCPLLWFVCSEMRIFQISKQYSTGLTLLSAEAVHAALGPASRFCIPADL